MTGVLTLVNAAIMMTKGWRDVLRAELILVLFASLPTLVGGYFLLDHLATNGLVYLRIILGAVIIISALQLVMPPKKEEKEATKSSFVFFGAFSGIMSGLFSTSGPQRAGRRSDVVDRAEHLGTVGDRSRLLQQVQKR